MHHFLEHDVNNRAVNSHVQYKKPQFLLQGQMVGQYWVTVKKWIRRQEIWKFNKFDMRKFIYYENTVITIVVKLLVKTDPHGKTIKI